MEVFLKIPEFLVKFDTVRIDNVIFRLHYSATVTFLLISSIVVSTKQFFGEPIHCLGNYDKLKDAINSYCWINGTYTVKRHLTGLVGRSVVSPGVGPHRQQDEVITHAYYQWVCLILSLQALLCYLPCLIWRGLENGRMAMLTEDLKSPMQPENWTPERKSAMVAYLLKTNLKKQPYYALEFTICEALNLVNTIFQIYLLDVFLGGTFRSYGAAVSVFNNEADAINPMSYAFPKMTKCVFHAFGPSGSLQRLDLLCVLPLNVINEKIFVIMWFWLLILAFLGTIALVYRVFLFLCPWLRASCIGKQAKSVHNYKIMRIIDALGFADWFLLHNIGKNVNQVVFQELLELLADNLNENITEVKTIFI